MSERFSRRVIARAVTAKLFEGPAHRQHWIKALAAYLVEHGHATDADLMVNDIARELYDERRYLKVDVTSARPLGHNVVEEIKQFLKHEARARDVELVEHVDPHLVGGIIARTPDSQLDLSVRTKLKAIAAIK